MNIDELKNGATNFDQPDENGVINNPNLIIRNRKRRVEANKNRTNQEPIVAMDPIAAGFKMVEKPEPELNDEQKALADLDAMIERKADEVRAVNELIDSTDGELTKGDIARAQGLSENIIKEMGYDEETIKVEGVSASEIIENDDSNFETERVGIDLDAIGSNSTPTVSIPIPNNITQLNIPSDVLDEYIPDAEEEDEEDNDVTLASEEIKTPNVNLPIDNIVPVNDDVFDTGEHSSKLFGLNEDDLRSAIDEIEADDDDDLLKLDDEELISDEDKEDDEADVSTDEQLQMLKNEVVKKIKPIHRAMDITGFSVVNKPLSINATLNNVSSPTRKSYDWVLMSSERPESMRGYSGEELDALNDLNGSNNANAIMDQYKRIYDHITDVNKPNSVKEWARSTSYLDIPHIWFNIYRSTFEGANFIPYDCPNPKCKNVFLSDDVPMVSMAKFKNDEAKEKFYKIYNTPNPNNKYLYRTDIIPVSDNYAIAFKEPSIYNTLFEPNMLSAELTEKYNGLIRILLYVDTVYSIDYEHQQLRPVLIKEYPKDEAKTVNERFKTLIRIAKTFTSDQLGMILTYIKDINNRADNSLVYVTPECTCPKCGTKIEEAEREPSDLVFTRHKLATLVAL